MTSALYLSKRALVTGGLAAAAAAFLPAPARGRSGDAVSVHLPGIEVLADDRQPMSVGELFAGAALDPSVRSFLVAELAAAGVVTDRRLF